MQQQLQQDKRHQQQPQYRNRSQIATIQNGVGGQVGDGYWSGLRKQIGSGCGIRAGDGVGRGGGGEVRIQVWEDIRFVPSWGNRTGREMVALVSFVHFKLRGCESF